MQDLRIKSLDFPHFLLTDAEEPNKKAWNQENLDELLCECNVGVLTPFDSSNNIEYSTCLNILIWMHFHMKNIAFRIFAAVKSEWNWRIVNFNLLLALYWFRVIPTSSIAISHQTTFNSSKPFKLPQNNQFLRRILW